MKTAHLLLVVGLALLSAQVVSIANANEGFIGIDYVYFISRLLEGVLFFRVQGLTPPLYSSWFCGGYPYHADPQVMFYSLPQLFTFFVEPWTAVQATHILLLFVAGVSCFMFCRRVLGWPAAIGLFVAFTFAGNGHAQSRLFVGHMTYHTVMLLPAFLLVLMDRRINVLLSTALLGLLVALVVNGGGNFVAFLIGPSVLICALFAWAVGGETVVSPKQMLVRGMCGGLLGALISASKLLANITMAAVKPRPKTFDTLDNPWEALEFGFSQLFYPGLVMPWQWEIWEYDCALSPLVGLGLVLLPFVLLKARPSRTALVFGLSAFTLSLLVFGFSIGLLAHESWFTELPIIKQMRVNARFMVILMLPATLAAGYTFVNIKLPQRAPLVFGAIALALSFYPGEFKRDTIPHYTSFEKAPLKPFWEQLHNAPLEQLKIREIVRFERKNDFYPVLVGKSNANCYEVFYKKPPTQRLQPGSVFLESVNAKGVRTLNFMNPACYVYPKENQCLPGFRILTSDRENLELLLSHKNPNWIVPRKQKLADWISLIAVCFSPILLFIGWKRQRNN